MADDSSTSALASEQCCWKPPSRSSSVESIYSIQGKETDYVRDTTDTESDTTKCDTDIEYEPVTDLSDDTVISSESGVSEEEIIRTKVIAVSVGDDGELSFADAEADDSDECDKESAYFPKWECKQCRAKTNIPSRYCPKCFKVRKTKYPPRPKRKATRATVKDAAAAKIEPHSSGVDSGFSQDSPQSPQLPHSSQSPDPSFSQSHDSDPLKRPWYRKRRASMTVFSNSDSDEDLSKKPKVEPITKTISDPQVSVEADKVKLTKKAIINSLKEKLDSDSLCIVCFSEPKSGVFVHGRIAHICCCYKCSVKVWARTKRCPMCNCKVNNVLRAVM